MGGSAPRYHRGQPLQGGRHIQREEDVCIGVTFEALLKGDLHAAEPKFVAVTEAVDVIAEARPERYL